MRTSEIKQPIPEYLGGGEWDILEKLEPDWVQEGIKNGKLLPGPCHFHPEAEAYESLGEEPLVLRVLRPNGEVMAKKGPGFVIAGDISHQILIPPCGALVYTCQENIEALEKEEERTRDSLENFIPDLGNIFG